MVPSPMIPIVGPFVCCSATKSDPFSPGREPAAADVDVVSSRLPI
jgi:hypothetical protein